MNITEISNSRYISAADLQGKQPTVIISRWEIVKMNDDKKKLVLYFQGKDKGLVLNKVNLNTIAEAYGDETDDWIGGKIILYETRADYQGRSVPCIRVKPAVQVQQRPTPGTTAHLLAEQGQRNQNFTGQVTSGNGQRLPAAGNGPQPLGSTVMRVAPGSRVVPAHIEPEELQASEGPFDDEIPF